MQATSIFPSTTPSCSSALASALDEHPLEVVLTLMKGHEGAGEADTFDPVRIPVGPQVAFTQEERLRVQVRLLHCTPHVQGLLELDQTILISFNDMEEEVAVKVWIGNTFNFWPGFE